ncbi:protein of unknown function [Methylocaldum szegediense]|uniref:Uncharacterized protein n=1 Tax=Methylocaldum szegediense TaxID=73780 RepID=A0ABN8X6K9_9GAMM|nr:protein of unknown function [Methylocaldum szegediense]
MLSEIEPLTTGNSYKKKQQKSNGHVFAIVFSQQGSTQACHHRRWLFGSFGTDYDP